MELYSRIIADLAALQKQTDDHRAVAESNALRLAEENVQLKMNFESAEKHLQAARDQLDALAFKYEAVEKDLRRLQSVDDSRCALVNETQKYAHDIIDFAKEGNHPPVVISVVQTLMRKLNGVSVDDEKALYAGTVKESVEGESPADDNVELDATSMVAAARPSVTANSTNKPVSNEKQATRKS